MAGALRLLVIEGNVEKNRKRAVASGGRVSSEAYGELLRQLSPVETVVDVCFPADPGANIPDQGGLEAYDGVAITGSALNVYDGGPAVDPQVELVRELFRTEVPCFGSCWGLQVATVAAGGVVRKHPEGREIGIGRRIEITEAGHGHALYVGKPPVFDAITVHQDDVETLPAGSTVLATNMWSPVQAAAIPTPGGGGFLGVQYHPEYTFAEIAAVFRRYGTALIDQGLFATMDEQNVYVAELDRIHLQPDDRALVWKYGLDRSVLDPAIRSLELKNWIEGIVLPKRSGRGRG